MSKKSKKRRDSFSRPDESATQPATRVSGSQSVGSSSLISPKSLTSPQTLPTPVSEPLPAVHRRFYPLWIVTALSVAALIGAFVYFAWHQNRLQRLERATAGARMIGDWNTVAERSRQWLEADQDSVPAKLFAAEAAHRLHDFSRAASLLESLPDSDSRSVEGLMQLIELDLGVLNRPEHFVQTLHRVLTIDPLHLPTRAKLLSYYGITWQRSAAMREAREQIRLGCESPAAYLYVMHPEWVTFSNGATLTERWLQAEPQAALYRVANLLHRIRSAELEEFHGELMDREARARIDDAFSRELMECIWAHPQNMELLAYLIERAVDTGDARHAAKWLSQVPATAADDERVWRAKGWVHATRGQLPQAEQAFRTAIEKNPYDWSSRHQLADVLRQQNRTEDLDSLLKFSAEGLNLKKLVLTIKNVNAITPELLSKMQEFAENVGDADVARRIEERLQIMNPTLR